MTPAAVAPSTEPEHEEDREDESDGEIAEGEGGGAGAAKKKKKKKPKKKKRRDPLCGGIVPPEVIPTISESPEEAERWAAELKPGVRSYSLDMWALLHDRERPKLNIFRTPACASFRLYTPRLILRQVEVVDTTAIRRVKMEPVVQKTQLYGSPSASDIKDSFQRRYAASSIPRLTSENVFRDEYIFAITAKEGSGIAVAPAGKVKISNRISSTEGYLGNIALSLETSSEVDAMTPQKGKTWIHPTLSECRQAGLSGKMFYELHPQLWGQGIVSEAFEEVLRFAMEELGCTKVSADPTTGNTASIRVCEKFGMTFSHETDDNPRRKTQLFYAVTREAWFARQAKVEVDHWGGRERCRWCRDLRTRPVVVCKCHWAKYCSRECQRADWVLVGGHQKECN